MVHACVRWRVCVCMRTYLLLALCGRRGGQPRARLGRLQAARFGAAPAYACGAEG